MPPLLLVAFLETGAVSMGAATGFVDVGPAVDGRSEVVGASDTTGGLVGAAACAWKTASVDDGDRIELLRGDAEESGLVGFARLGSVLEVGPLCLHVLASAPLQIDSAIIDSLYRKSIAGKIER